MKKYLHNNAFSFFAKGLPNGDVGGARGTVFQEIRPGAGFEAGDFDQEKLGGVP